MSYEEEDTCLPCARSLSHTRGEEEDTDMSYEEEDTCLACARSLSLSHARWLVDDKRMPVHPKQNHKLEVPKPKEDASMMWAEGAAH